MPIHGRSTDENGSSKMVKKRLDFSVEPKRNSCNKESEEKEKSNLSQCDEGNENNNLSKSDESVEFNWNKLLKKFQKVDTFLSVCLIVVQNSIPDLVMKRKYSMTLNDQVCKVAKKFFPADGPRNVLPVHTIGDGNCFPRALSQAVISPISKLPESGSARGSDSDEKSSDNDGNLNRGNENHTEDSESAESMNTMVVKRMKTQSHEKRNQDRVVNLVN